MYSLLLRKALPFALTFIIGSLVGGLFKSIGFGGGTSNARAYFYRHGGRHGCDERARRRFLVAESKPLQILDKPSPWWSWGRDVRRPASVRVLVTFGADGRVQSVEQLDHFELPKEITESAKNAAWRIRFEPETVNGMPVSVTKEVEINFLFE